jgi:hypothetical protein
MSNKLKIEELKLACEEYLNILCRWENFDLFVIDNSVSPNERFSVEDFGQIANVGQLMDLSKKEKEKSYQRIQELIVLI